eukprot:CAMPEP_0174721276 /NCGR_PEP_ID=MMETSP1094-20130205/35740_1 /TAXON_ID=156173 /ORGANISM="Chrysochromulina brevifilum, Strain UTEX LB 985" /LENGTH=690 /DNA_ID=CAMNT_0015921931 /DNA_START=48 /DNA_END=2120 /DNA_ORIENTATION=+
MDVDGGSVLLETVLLADLVDEALFDPSAAAGAWTGRCWGMELSGESCTPDFQPGNGHFKNKFCNACRTHGFMVAADRVRAVSSSPQKAFSNANGRSIWTNEARLVNQTIKCVGPRLVIFRQHMPAEAGPSFTLVPDQWLRVGPTGFQVHFAVKLGTLVPTAAPRPAAGAVLAEDAERPSVEVTAKRPREKADDFISAYALTRSDNGVTVNASAEDVEALAIASTSDPLFRQNFKDRLSVCAATIIFLDEADRHAMHSMFREAMERRLAVSVGDERLARILRTVENGGLLPAGTLDSGAHMEIVILCSTICDTGAWMQVCNTLSSHLVAQQRAALADKSVLTLADQSLVPLTESIALLSMKAHTDESSAEAPGDGGLATEGWRAAVQHTAALLHDMLRTSDQTAWDVQVIDLPPSTDQSAAAKGCSLSTCAADGLVYCLLQLKLDGATDALDVQASGGLGKPAAVILDRTLELCGLRRTAPPRNGLPHEQLWQLGGMGTLFGEGPGDGIWGGVLHGLLQGMLSFWGTCALEVRREEHDDGARIVLVDWDSKRDQPLFLDEARQLANVSVGSIHFDTSTRTWCISWIETHVTTMKMPFALSSIGNLPRACGSSVLTTFIRMTTAMTIGACVQCLVRALKEMRVFLRQPLAVDFRQELGQPPSPYQSGDEDGVISDFWQHWEEGGAKVQPRSS